MRYNKTSILFGFTRKKQTTPVKHQLGEKVLSTKKRVWIRLYVGICVHTGACSTSSVFVTGRREKRRCTSKSLFKNVNAGTFLGRPQRPRRFVCAPLTLPGHLQFPVLLRPRHPCGIPTVGRGGASGNRSVVFRILRSNSSKHKLCSANLLYLYNII